MPQIPWAVKVREHPGSTAEEISNEPHWDATHPHRVGFKNSQDRVAGITHGSDEYQQEIEQAREQAEELQKHVKHGDLVNFRDVVRSQKDFHLEHPENRPVGWRYVLNTSEDWVQNQEAWPANLAKQKKEQEEKEKTGSEGKDVKDKGTGKEEHEREASGSKHHPAYDKYTPQEISLLRMLQLEKDYISKLEQNNGQHESPQKRHRSGVGIDEKDQFTPDNWIPRDGTLVRLTGKHPLNAEAPLSELFDAGIITPNELHYVRNHGAVPRLMWEFHKLDVNDGGLTLSMDALKNDYPAINIPIALACDGNRRKELNMIRRSKGFNWGAGAVSCAYWKGALLRDVLASAGLDEEKLLADREKRYWVNFEGADSPSEGRYATSIPYDYAIDPANDVILAYEMNNVPLPPDHGYPVRLMIPGYVGGRCVKWLSRIWITEKENESYYHVWDNRVLPSFVTSKDGEFAETLFRHPDTACNEQNLNSAIVKPAQGERIPLTSARHGASYRIAGYAYDGGGHKVQRVEVSLDEGATWLYCIRKFPERPIRHGNKYWAWVHWHVDVEVTHLVRAPSIVVRCFNVFKNTQPEKPSWNIMGMMNNCWYKVTLEVSDSAADNRKGDYGGGEKDVAAILCRHPVEPGTGEGGWMKPSVENQIATIKQEAGTPQKQFTREEVEKHDSADDCWLVIDGKVYDATSVLDWHPGGKAAIASHAGKVHQQTTDEFASIHDDYAYQKLKECAIGTLTDKAVAFVKHTAEQAAKDAAGDAPSKDDRISLNKHRWIPVKLVHHEDLSHDTRRYTFSLPEGHPLLGLGTCQHVQIGFHLEDKMLIRSYTPTKPLLPSWPNEKGSPQPGAGDLSDGQGTFDLTVKTYFPDETQPGGALSNILDCLPLGSEVELKGPTGEIEYRSDGSFVIEGRERHFKRVSLVLGGSGITPGYALIARILLDKSGSGKSSDPTELRVVDANKTESDILLRNELHELETSSGGQLKITYVLSHPEDEGSWKGEKGHVNEEIIKMALFEPAKDSVVFLCGPPAMIQKAALPALKNWGYVEDDNMFGF
ncbi:hypothetical protein Micbo1qcDRAFT_212694 [Microdochium bolleyi]|uniref:Nitrate reductase [NADPH] n=1 Tax=Microdochium bolleyi TaxID=196109 RepID=A0A136IWP9_9PEZI|nr:hypothetical protein Micbo1qcDRAFT_212694 [Microdochium bolleyi]